MKKVIIGIFLFIFSIGIGYYYATLWKKENISTTTSEKNIIEENSIIETSSEEEKILYNTDFAIKKYYNECGHFNFNYVELPQELINLSKNELSELYPNFEIEKFGTDEVVISEHIDKMCENHYVLKLEDNNIGVYRMVEADDLELIRKTDISEEYLTGEDIQKLEKGIYVFGIGNLNSALEDFE